MVSAGFRIIRDQGKRTERQITRCFTDLDDRRRIEVIIVLSV